MEKKLAGGKDKVNAPNDPSSQKELEQMKNEGVAKKPELQKEISVSGEPAPIEHPFKTKANADAPEVHLNHVGQKIDTSLSDAASYVTPEGKHMVIQMEEGDEVFAGEYGHNAHWYPKKVVDTWTKLDKVKSSKENK